MRFSEAYQYVKQSERRKRILLHLRQPSTVKQLSHLARLSLGACCHVVWELRVYQLVKCLNVQARRGRVYWLTELGQKSRQNLLGSTSPEFISDETPSIDWNLYGSVCFSHRSAVLKAISNPVQPATIKRIARFQDPTIRMSANNVRDVIKFFVAEGVVTRIAVRGKHHPRYELTELGEIFQLLLLRAEGTR